MFVGAISCAPAGAGVLAFRYTRGAYGFGVPRASLLANGTGGLDTCGGPAGDRTREKRDRRTRRLTSAATSPARAPSATRMPISRRRPATERDTTPSNPTDVEATTIGAIGLADSFALVRWGGGAPGDGFHFAVEGAILAQTPCR